MRFIVAIASVATLLAGCFVQEDVAGGFVPEIDVDPELYESLSLFDEPELKAACGLPPEEDDRHLFCGFVTSLDGSTRAPAGTRVTFSSDRNGTTTVETDANGVYRYVGGFATPSTEVARRVTGDLGFERIENEKELHAFRMDLIADLGDDLESWVGSDADTHAWMLLQFTTRNGLRSGVRVSPRQGDTLEVFSFSGAGPFPGAIDTDEVTNANGLLLVGATEMNAYGDGTVLLEISSCETSQVIVEAAEPGEIRIIDDIDCD